MLFEKKNTRQLISRVKCYKIIVHCIIRGGKQYELRRKQDELLDAHLSQEPCYGMIIVNIQILKGLCCCPLRANNI